jgi:hypothetical protein
MGFLYQMPAIVGGTVLVIERIQSQNFQAGVFGWAIYANGDAEFNNVTVRGTLITGPAGSRHIEVNGADAPQGIAFYTGEPDETFPGVIQPDFVATELTVTHSSPLVAGHAGAFLTLTTGRSGADKDRVALSAQEFDFSADIWSFFANATRAQSLLDGTGQYLELDAPRVFLRDTAIGASAGAVMIGGDLLRIGQVWTALPLVNAWVNIAGAAAGYTKDATGRVQLRGGVITGAAVLIATLPVGNRPSQSMEWIMRGQGGVVMCAVLVATTGAITVTANFATATANGIRLDSISFPTL